MCDGILISSVCTFSLSNGLCLFQGEEPGQGRGNEASQPPLQAQRREVFLPPDLPGELDFFGGDDDSEARILAAGSVLLVSVAVGFPPAASVIFLYSPNL
jgi:hypothetical protein